MVLPRLYQRWIDELLPRGIAPETRATCQECAMVDRGGPSSPELPFNPAVKCCTYHPELPNYLVGKILADERPEAAEARRVLEERIAARVGVTPYGLSAPAAFTLIYQNAAVFGRSEQLRCPFYVVDGGRCGIHEHREGVCATWFCRYERGATGRAFWRVLNVLLKAFDSGLRAWALDEVDGGGATASAIWMVDLTKQKTLDEHALAGGAASAAEHAWVWGRWVGHEAELYRRCAELVEPLELARVLEICGAQTLAASRVVQLLHGTLSRARPERVMRGNGLVQIGRQPGEMRIMNAAAPYDHVDLPAGVIAAVPRLTSGALSEAVEEIRAFGIPLDDATLQWLLDFEVVVGAG